ncbi:MAG: WD40/YVTN/BNR-like repeat-containing protein [Ktedonobacterales bacterium]
MQRIRQHTRFRGPALGGLIIAVLLLLAGCSLGSSDGWERVGSTDGHIVLSLAADPFLKQIYVGTDGGVVYRLRTDQPDTLLASDGLPKDGVIGAILPDTHTHGLVYAGSSRGLYVTTDGGAHWQARGTGFPANDTMSALVAGSDQQTLIAGSQEHGVYVSHDGGATWQSSSTGMPGKANIYTLFSDQTSQAIYAAVDGVGVFASTDAGRSWTERSAGLPAHVFALAALPNYGVNPYGTTLYAGTERGLYASVDDGAHWVLTGSALATSRVLSLTLEPTTPGALYAGTDAVVLRSSDGGRNWHGVAPGPNTHIASLLIVGGVIFAGTNELLRYPPRGGTNITNSIVNLLFLLALGVVGFLLLRRSRKRMWQMEQRTRTATAEQMARMRSQNEAAYDSRSHQNGDGSLQEETVREDATDAAEAERTGDERSR